MKQNEFDMMTPERLELLLCYQQESTELEQMLVKRLVLLGDEVADLNDQSVGSDMELDTANSEIDDLEHRIEGLESTISDIEEQASDVETPEDAEEAIVEILKLCNE